MKKRNGKQSKKVQPSNNVEQTIVRPIVLKQQPEKIADVGFNYTALFNLSSSGGLYYYGNKQLKASLYQVESGVSAVIPGLSIAASKYAAYIPTRMKVKLTFANATTAPALCAVYPTPSLLTDNQASLQQGFRLPEAKKLILGSNATAKGIGVLVHEANLSQLNGYDILHGDARDWITQFGSNPTYSQGLQIIHQSVDGLTIPNINVTAEITIFCRMVIGKQVLN